MNREPFKDAVVGGFDDSPDDRTRVDRFGQGGDDEVGVAGLFALVELAADQRDLAFLRIGQRLDAAIGPRRAGLGIVAFTSAEATAHAANIGPFRLAPLFRTLARPAAVCLAAFAAAGRRFASEHLGGKGDRAEPDRVELERRAAFRQGRLERRVL